MGHQPHPFQGPALAVRQVGGRQAGKEGAHVGRAFAVADSIHPGAVAGRVGRHVVLDGAGQVDEFWHAGFPSGPIVSRPWADHLGAMNANLPVPPTQEQPQAGLLPVVVRRVIGWTMLLGAFSVSGCVALFT